MTDQPLEHPLPKPDQDRGGPELPDWNATRPPRKTMPDSLWVLPGGHVTAPEDHGIDPNYTDVFASASDEKALDAMATDLQRRDPAGEHNDLSHAEVKEALRQDLIQRYEAQGGKVPLSVLFTELGVRVRTDAGSLWADMERRHEAWSTLRRPTLPILNHDGSVVRPATLKKATVVASGLLIVLLLLGVPWNFTLLIPLLTWAAIVSYPGWLPRLCAVAEALKTRAQQASRPPEA